MKAISTSLVETFRKDCKEMPPTTKIGKHAFCSFIQGQWYNDHIVLREEEDTCFDAISSFYPNVTVVNNEKKTPEEVHFITRESMEWTL